MNSHETKGEMLEEVGQTLRRAAGRATQQPKPQLNRRSGVTVQETKGKTLEEIEAIFKTGGKGE